MRVSPDASAMSICLRAAHVGCVVLRFALKPYCVLEFRCSSPAMSLFVNIRHRANARRCACVQPTAF